MTFRQFALNNVFRNKRLYAAYFLSSLFTVMVFFTFVNFAFHPDLSGDGMHSNVTQGMVAAGSIIYVFSFFFILYSMSSFLQSRKREFGILMIQGMSNTQIRWMVFLENMVIGFFATIVGIGFGLIFAKFILLIAENVLELKGTLHFYFPTLALLITFGSFIILFFFISLFVTFVLRTKRLVILIKGDRIGKPEPKASLLLTALAILLLGSGYGIALTVKGLNVVLALFPVVILVIVGTYLLFAQLSVFVIKKLKSNQGLFWQKTNMLLFSDLAYRMKDNARAFFMVAIISTVAFSAIGTLVGFSSIITGGIMTNNSISFTYSIVDEEEEVPNVYDTFDQYNLEVDEAKATLNYFKTEDGDNVLIASTEEYNEYARLLEEKEITLGPDDVLVVDHSDAMMMDVEEHLEGEAITLADGTTLQADQTLTGVAKPDIIPELYRYYIVGSNVFEELPTPEFMEENFGWQVVNGSKEDEIAAGQELSENNPGLFALKASVHEINKAWSSVLFVGLFIGIVFFVSAGSFLYFRLYTDLDEDKAKFSAISKIGLTAHEMNRVISKQIALLFFTPIIVAIIHGAVALTALSHLFEHNLVRESVLVLGSFLVIQIVYFIIVRYLYTKQVKRFVQG